MITATILTYNEERRIRLAVRHAIRWADEVLVIDKGSTDRTREIAEGMGARVAQIPFSRQGHERVEDITPLPTHDWIVGLTPGEVPTRTLIDAIRHHLDTEEGFDVLLVPVISYSFGVFHPQSPWGGGYQPRVYHLHRARRRNVVHSTIDLTAERTRAIPLTADCYLLHQTHATADSFLRSHADYAAADHGLDPHEQLAAAEKHLALADTHFDGLPQHRHAWLSYWHAIALHAHERICGADHAADYHARAEELIETEWP